MIKFSDVPFLTSSKNITHYVKERAKIHKEQGYREKC